jgi:uroporphyrinogen-III decarboxylase
MSRSVEALGRLGADIIDLDSLVPLEPARAAVGPNQVLLGNLNPVTELMTSTPATIATELAERHRHAGPRWIVGAGCEIPAATPPENVEALVAYARGTRP